MIRDPEEVEAGPCLPAPAGDRGTAASRGGGDRTVRLFQAGPRSSRGLLFES